MSKTIHNRGTKKMTICRTSKSRKARVTMGLHVTMLLITAMRLEALIKM